jgi:secondary thiamine-phosphate synthase enzyme
MLPREQGVTAWWSLMRVKLICPKKQSDDVGIATDSIFLNLLFPARSFIISKTMNWHKTTLEISTSGKGLHDITSSIRMQLKEWGVREGMCFLFMQHTSASLVISENWDPTARADLETFMERLVPEGDKWYTHDLEGPDDATSHIRTMLTDTSLSIPVDDGDLSLGTWQGVYVFEHRARPHRRKVLMRVLTVE